MNICPVFHNLCMYVFTFEGRKVQGHLRFEDFDKKARLLHNPSPSVQTGNITSATLRWILTVFV